MAEPIKVESAIEYEGQDRFEILLDDGRVIIGHEHRVDQNPDRKPWQNEAGEPIMSPEGARAEMRGDHYGLADMDPYEQDDWYAQFEHEDDDEESSDMPINEDGHLEAAYEARYEIYD